MRTSMAGYGISLIVEIREQVAHLLVVFDETK